MALVEETRDTFDVDVRHRFHLGDRNEIVWGGGYRLSHSEVSDSPEVRLNRPSRSDQVANAFVQDQIQLMADRLSLTLGSKLEHNDYTGIEFEPGARLAWTPTAKQTVWASVARAVRTPSQMEHDARINLGVLPPAPPAIPLPTLVSVQGDASFGSETLIAYELGYRIQAHPRLMLDAAAFINDYDDLRSGYTRLDMSAVPNYVGVESVFNNQGQGQTYGGELAATWQTTDWWRLVAQFSVIGQSLREPADSLTGQARETGISSPNYQASLRSSMDLGNRVELDAWLRYADGLTAAGGSVPGLVRVDVDIPSYVTFDVRLAWRPVKQLELTLVGQNLAGSHREFNPTFVSTQATEVSRSIYGKLTWRF
jgi:iron complex outermembrane receptor protein